MSIPAPLEAFRWEDEQGGGSRKKEEEEEREVLYEGSLSSPSRNI